MPQELKSLKTGDYFTLKSIENPKESQIFVKGEYNKSEKKYFCYKFSDVNACRSFAGNKTVYTDGTF